MSDTTDTKGNRLLAEGAVTPDASPAFVFHVKGDHGGYIVVLGAHVQQCTCEARRACSHIDAASKWLHAQDRNPDKHAEYVAAREARRAHDRALADEAFARLGA